MTGTAQVVRANSRELPLEDNSVDLICTSPPYFALRSYQDGGEHYEGQIGSEATPAEFVDALLEVTRECVRVLKPSGSLWVNLGDKYAGSQPNASRWHTASLDGGRGRLPELAESQGVVADADFGSARPKSLIGIPWRYAIRCIDDLGLILRAEVIWSKPNGLPESVTDRVRRSHEQWFHFTLQPRYFSAVDEVREPSTTGPRYDQRATGRHVPGSPAQSNLGAGGSHLTEANYNPLGKLPGSVWVIPTEPLQVPESLGVDHFAAFPTEWPRRIIQGWSPAGVCVECGEGRRPVTDKRYLSGAVGYDSAGRWGLKGQQEDTPLPSRMGDGAQVEITGYTCACPEPTAPTTPGVVLDPFGGTGTTAMVAKALGRHGISVDMSADYCRLAEWRTNDPKQLAKAARKPFTPSQEPIDGQGDLLDLLKGGAA